jgi:hypothetical protein
MIEPAWKEGPCIEAKGIERSQGRGLKRRIKSEDEGPN